MRTFVFASLLAAVAAINDGLAREAMNCGGCYYTDEDGFLRCNTGSDATKFPYSSIQPTRNLSEIPDLVAEQGVSTATFMTISEMKTAVAAYNESWDLMFCSSYLNQYKDGDVVSGVYSDPGTGAACVRSATAEAIIQADSEARAHYRSFGTTNGYPSSWAVSKSDSTPVEMKQWGTGGSGDVPSNWCSVYMKYLLCGVAFPQVAMTEAERTAARDAADVAGTVPDTTGALRPVELDSCKDLFMSCNRREPWEDETKGDFVHPSLNNVRAQVLEGQSEMENALENDFFCKMWARGYDLGSAGPSILDSDSNTITFEAGALSMYSPLLLIISAAAMLIVA